MDDKDLLNEIDDYCRKTGFKPSTVCMRALGDSRFMARHTRRANQIQKDTARLRKYMADHPPAEMKEVQP